MRRSRLILLPMERVLLTHPFPPVFDGKSRVLILGSFPSAASRSVNFYYGHPRNRFWQVLALVLGGDVPASTEEKKAFLLKNRIAVWDVIASCDISGSSDTSIRNVTVNDLGAILERADIRGIFANGKTAWRYYRRYTEARTGRPAVCLPSTSPANAAWDASRLAEEWKQIRSCLEQDISE